MFARHRGWTVIFQIISHWQFINIPSWHKCLAELPDYNGAQIEGLHLFHLGPWWFCSFCDFYLHQNLIRIYDIKGNLLKHIQVIDNACVPSTSVELRPVFHELKFNSKYIAVLYNNKYSTEEIYSDEKLIQELQLWNWKGELKKRICFDFPFDIYAISEDDILYAVNSGRPDYIYTYDLKWNLSVSRHAPTHTDAQPYTYAYIGLHVFTCEPLRTYV